MTIETLLIDYQNPKQARDLIFLLDQYASDPMGGGTPLPEEIKAKLASKLANLPNAFSVICYVHGEPAALANCLFGFSTFKCQPLINIHDFMVHTAFRKQGLSKLLLKKIEDIGKEYQCCKITLEVLEGNHIAQVVYTSSGFKGYSLDDSTGKALFWEKQLH